MSASKEIIYNDSLAESGIIYLIINYEADNEGEYQKTILLVNYSDKEIEMDSISDMNYSAYKALIGKVNDEEGKTKIQGLTFYTFTELKVNNVPNWVYILVTIVLLLMIFGIRALCVKLLKTKHGIDYEEYIKEQRQKNKKQKRKEKERGPSIIETYLGTDPLFKRKQKVKPEQSAQVQETKEQEEIKEEQESEEKNEEANQ
jgi:hypothetical protein